MADDKKGKSGGGLLGWLRGDKRADETGKVPVVKLTATSEHSGMVPIAPGPEAGAKQLNTDVTVRYNDKGEIARGGMGSIRKVFDDNLQRTVAMKVAFPEHRSDTKIMQRFAEEAQIMGQLEHPNIVPVHDFGEDDGTKFFTMLFVRGKTLTDLLGDNGAVDTREEYFRFLSIFLRVLDAVAFAHSRGVVHRDLKPDNIMVGNFGEVYLMDWGIAKLLHRTGGMAPAPGGQNKTMVMSAIGKSIEDIIPVRVRREGGAPVNDETGQIIGTFFYMAPEQALAQTERIDERTDIFLLGGVLYEILTKQPPYMGSTVVDVVRQAQACQILRPELISPEAGIPKNLADICMKCLQADPDNRYQTVLELKKDVEKFLKGGAGLPTKLFPSGQLLMEEGQPGEEVYIVQKGTVQVYQTDKSTGRRRGLATLGPGAVVGEASVFRASVRSASVVAVDDVQAVVVTRKQLEHELGLNSWIGSLVKALADRFFTMNDRFTKADEQNNSLKVTNWVLQYLVLYGHTGPSGRREVQWAHLLQACIHQFQKPENELRAILTEGKQFTIDDARNSIWFSAA
jgi:serine/threonine-protein kinase